MKREPEDDRGHDDERDESSHDERKGLVVRIHDDGGLPRQARREADPAVGHPLGPPRVDAAQPELVLRPQHGDTIAGDHLVVPARALGHLAAVPGHDGHGRQVAEVAAEGRMRRLRFDHVHLDHGELHPAQLDVMRVASEAGLYERRAGQGSHVQHASPPRHSFQGPGHRRVGQLGHNADVGSNLADAQRRFERMNLSDFGADHGQGMF